MVKPKALYIDRNSQSYKSELVVEQLTGRNNIIFNFLSERFDVDRMYNILNIPADYPFKEYKLLVTHLQEGPDIFQRHIDQFNYWDSIFLLKGIHQENPDLAIIVYTGVWGEPHLDERLKNAGVSRVIKKGRMCEIEIDINELKGCLDDLFPELK